MTLLLHRGSTVVDETSLAGVETPAATATWTPVPHATLLETVVAAVESAGLSVLEKSLAIGKGGARFFGVLTLAGSHDDYAATIGLRNSHDCTLGAALALGSRVFVCDNLAFHSEVVIKTRHTARVMERLPKVVSDGVARLSQRREWQDQRIASYKARAVSDERHLHDLAMRMYRARAIPATAIVKVVEEFESPTYEAFADWNLWSLFNAATHVLKGHGDLQPRTQRLHGVLDAEIDK